MTSELRVAALQGNSHNFKINFDYFIFVEDQKKKLLENIKQFSKNHHSHNCFQAMYYHHHDNISDILYYILMEQTHHQ